MASTIVTPPADKSLTRNPIYVTLESDHFTGSPGAYVPAEDNLSCHLEVWVDGTLITTLRGPYSSIDKRITFDISRVIDSVLLYVLPTPASIGVTGTPAHAAATGLVGSYYLKHADKYGDPAETEALETSDTYLAIKGGLPRDALQNINWAGALIGLHSYYYKRNSAFPFYKPVSRTQPDYIYFVALVTDDIEVTITRFYDDGTNDYEVKKTIAATASTAYWVVSGYDHLHVATGADADKTIVGYSVSLIRVTGAQNAFTAFYVLDDMCPSWERHILYHNGFGGFETVRMKGVTRYTHKVTRLSFERTTWTDFSTEVGTVDDIRVLGAAIFNTHTGHYPSWYVEHLRQLLHAKMWLVDMDLSLIGTYRFLRIVSETDSIELRSDIPSADGFAITYRHSWDDDGYNVY